jgi:hypothetical protein
LLPNTPEPPLLAARRGSEDGVGCPLLRRWRPGRDLFRRREVPDQGDVDGVLLERGETNDVERPFMGGREHHVGGHAVFVRP